MLQSVTDSFRNSQPVNPLKSEAKALFLAGQSASQIAVTLSLRGDLVRSWISRGQWGMPRQAVEKRVEQALSQRVTGLLVRQSNTLRGTLGRVLQAQADVLEANPAKTVKELANDGQGHAAVLKTISDAGRTVMGWDEQSAKMMDDAIEFADAIDVQEVKPVEQLTQAVEPEHTKQ